MQVEESYDLVVVGDQISGFFLAAGAAQAGYKVLVIEGTTSSTALFEVPSGNFLTDLVWEPLIGITKHSRLNHFFQSLGLYQDPEELFPSFTPSVQIISEKARMDFSYDSKEQAKEWEREFPALHRRLDQWNRGLNSFKGTFAESIQRAELGVEWEQLGAMQMALYGAYLPKKLQCSTYRALIKRAAGGVRYPIGGRSALKERLIGRLQVFGGKIKRNTWVEEVVFEHGKLSGVLLSSFEGFVRSPRVVGAMGAHSFFSLLPKQVRPSRLERELRSIEPRYWRMSYTIRVPENAIPEGMGNHVAIHDFSAELEQENFLQVLALPRDVYGGIAPNQRVLLVRVLMPYEKKTLEPRFISTVMKRSIKRLEQLIPGLDKIALAVVPDPERLDQDPIFQKYFTFKSLNHIPSALLVYESALNNVQEDTMASDWKDYGLEGIVLCSRDVHPLYGLMGEALSAIELLDGPLKKKTEGKPQ